MAISMNGITTSDGTTYTWDELNGASVADQKSLLASAGLGAGDIKNVLGKLNTLEQDEFKAWVVNNTSGNQTPQERQAWLQAVKEYDTGKSGAYLGPSDPYSGQGGLEGNQGFERGLSGQQIAQNIGIGSLVNQVSAEQKTNKALGRAPGGDPAGGGINQAMTSQALNDYYTQMMAPALQQYQSMVNGDMAQWGSMINQIKGATAGADVNFATPNLQLYGQLQNLYGQSSMLNQAFGPFMQYQNNLAGQNMKIGQTRDAQGAAIANLITAAQTDPAIAAALNGGGLAGAIGGTGTNAVTNIMNQVNPASAAIANSGQAALNKNTQQAPTGA